jgi:tRNA pseudouridine55 synthase
MTPGIHLVHKPPGLTSFYVLQSFRAMNSVANPPRPPRLCHGGALDPFANGLLLILVEPATRLFDYLHAAPKVYDATIHWGIETDTGDPLGIPTFTGDASQLSPARCDEALKSFIGWHDQIPPSTSNKRVDGERAYIKAHRGEIFTLPPSRVYLYEATWLSHDLPRESRLRITVAGGYYVRSLARDLGRLLGCGAHLAQLRRTAIGPWKDPGPDANAGASAAITGRGLLPWLPSRTLTDQEVGDLRQERAVPRDALIAADWFFPAGFPVRENAVRGFHQDRFLFLLKMEDNRLRATTSLSRGV